MREDAERDCSLCFAFGYIITQTTAIGAARRTEFVLHAGLRYPVLRERARMNVDDGEQRARWGDESSWGEWGEFTRHDEAAAYSPHPTINRTTSYLRRVDAYQVNRPKEQVAGLRDGRDGTPFQ